MRDFFELRTGRVLRGNSLTLYKSGFATDIGKFCFRNRVIDSWNALPESVVACDKLSKFKELLDLHLWAGRRIHTSL